MLLVYGRYAMIRRFVFGSCLALSLFYGDCWGMDGTLTHSISSGSLSKLGTSLQTEEARPSSAPVTAREIQDAISRWGHLVPEGETKSEIDRLIPGVLDDEARMQSLVQVLCCSDSKYANYAATLFSDIFAKIETLNCLSYGALLSYICVTKASDSPSTYWNEYKEGVFD